MHAPGTPPPVGLTFFFPAYNDSGTIASLVITALQTARRLTPNFEIIIVNDGSADGTAEIASELARTYPEVKVVHVICDNAVTHRSAITQKALGPFSDRLKLHFLPTYCPEENPIEICTPASLGTTTPRPLRS